MRARKWEICVQGQHPIMRNRDYIWVIDNNPTGNIFGELWELQYIYYNSSQLCSNLCITLYLQPNLLFVSFAWLNLYLVIGWLSEDCEKTEKPFLSFPRRQKLNLEFTCALWSMGRENGASTRLEIVDEIILSLHCKWQFPAVCEQTLEPLLSPSAADMLEFTRLCYFTDSFESTSELLPGKFVRLVPLMWITFRNLASLVHLILPSCTNVITVK